MSDNFTQITPRAAKAIAQTVKAVRLLGIDAQATPNAANSIRYDVEVQTTDLATKFGCYMGFIVGFPDTPPDFTSATPISDSDVGVTLGKCWIVNLAEKGATGHILD